MLHIKDTRCSIQSDTEHSLLREAREVEYIMINDEIYEKILPYLSEPKSIKEFLDKHRDSSVEDMIHEINKLMGETGIPLQTDLRILLNALLKRS